MEPPVWSLFTTANDQIGMIESCPPCLGPVPCGADGRGLLIEEGDKQLRQIPFAIGEQLSCPWCPVRPMRTVKRFSPPRTNETAVIGENPVGQSVAVANELLAVWPFAALHLVEIRTDVLGLDVAQRGLLVRYDEVGTPHFTRFGSL